MLWCWNLQNMLETPFPPLTSKNPGEFPIFGAFFSEKFNFGLYFPENRHFEVDHIWKRHCDVIRWPIFKILVSMERGDRPVYYGTTQLYFGRVNFKFIGVVTTSLRKMCYRKYLRKTRANLYTHFRTFKLKKIAFKFNSFFSYLNSLNTNVFTFWPIM